MVFLEGVRFLEPSVHKSARESDVFLGWRRSVIQTIESTSPITVELDTQQTVLLSDQSETLRVQGVGGTKCPQERPHGRPSDRQLMYDGRPRFGSRPLSMILLHALP